MLLPPSPHTIERWKLDLVRARAVRLGFRGADLEDAQQDVLHEVILFRFQADQANGANETTALIALIDRRLFMVRRRQRRYRQRLERMQQWSDPESLEIDREQTDHQERTACRLDVQELLTRLTPADRAICESLAAGESVDAIATRLQCSWHTIKRRVEHIRDLLLEMGVDGYVK